MKKTRLSDIFNADSIRNKKRILDRFEINKKEKRLFLDAIEEVKNNEGGSDEGGSDEGNVLKEKDCNFYDYDGTLLYSYTKEEALALTELPPLPTQPGLLCQDWNYMLEDAKAYVAEYGVIDIGASYITDDGKTRLYITIAAEGRMNVPLRLQQSVSEGIVIDWGDGSTTTFSGTLETTLRHTYDKVGDYVITLEVINGTLTLIGTSSVGIFSDSMRVYSNMLQKVEFGHHVTSIGAYAFYYCHSLKSIVIPEGIRAIGAYAFCNCYSLTHVVIPNGMTNIGVNLFSYCYSLTHAVIPNSVKSINNYMFDNCHSLVSIVVPNTITDIRAYAFQYCYSLTSIVIPNSVTKIKNHVFYYCHSLKSIVIPNSVISTGTHVLFACISLASIVIPNSVTSIESYALNCRSVAFFDFSTHTSVPKLSNINAFNNSAPDFKIVVPDILYDEWIVATNWPEYVDHIIKASEYELTKQ